MHFSILWIRQTVALIFFYQHAFQYYKNPNAYLNFNKIHVILTLLSDVFLITHELKKWTNR